MRPGHIRRRSPSCNFDLPVFEDYGHCATAVAAQPDVSEPPCAPAVAAAGIRLNFAIKPKRTHRQADYKMSRVVALSRQLPSVRQDQKKPSDQDAQTNYQKVVSEHYQGNGREAAEQYYGP
jgi:hypothetical protein